MAGLVWQYSEIHISTLSRLQKCWAKKKKLYEFSVQLHDNDQNAATQTSGLGSLQYFQQLLMFLSV